MSRLTPALLDEYRQFNAAQERARAEYRAHPTVAAAEDWCTRCCWPRARRNCEVCAGVVRERNRKARLRKERQK